MKKINKYLIDKSTKAPIADEETLDAMRCYLLFWIDDDPQAPSHRYIMVLRWLKTKNWTYNKTNLEHIIDGNQIYKKEWEDLLNNHFDIIEEWIKEAYPMNFSH